MSDQIRTAEFVPPQPEPTSVEILRSLAREWLDEVRRLNPNEARALRALLKSQAQACLDGAAALQRPSGQQTEIAWTQEYLADKEAEQRLIVKLRAMKYVGGFDLDEQDPAQVEAARRIEKLRADFETEREMHNAWRKRADEAEALQRPSGQQMKDETSQATADGVHLDARGQVRGSWKRSAEMWHANYLVESELRGLDKQDARRYRRLRVLGVGPYGSKQLDQGTVIRFTTLDDFVDADLSLHQSRGEADVALPRPSGALLESPDATSGMSDPHAQTMTTKRAIQVLRALRARKERGAKLSQDKPLAYSQSQREIAAITVVVDYIERIRQ